MQQRAISFTKTFLLAVLCFVFSALFAHPQLSDSASISLLTVSPGEELYAAFGHTGIRVTDFKNDFDVVFNYGTFDFAQPGFYTNFLKGKMRYMISTDRFQDFMSEYIYEKRSVAELKLNLTPEDKQKVFAFLYNNALPQNREYFYDFFWDNCATRPRDVFEKVLGNRLQYHTDAKEFEKNKTLHDMLRAYVKYRPWVDYGFDLILGMPCEKIATPRDQTFLPDYAEMYLSSATLDGHPFATERRYLLMYPMVKIEHGFLPIHLSLLLVAVAFLLWAIERRTKKHYYTFDFILFFTTGLLGTFFLCMWLFTAHYSVPQNLNMLWLVPLHLPVSFLLLRKTKPQWLKFYFAATYVLMIALFIAWQWLPQRYNIAVMPLVFLLSFRSALIAINVYKNRKP